MEGNCQVNNVVYKCEKKVYKNISRTCKRRMEEPFL